jgi:hypothetical protein
MVAPMLHVGVSVILTAEMVELARQYLAGEVRASVARPEGNVRIWWRARRAVADLLVPYLTDPDGTVLPAHVADQARGMLTGAVKPPVLADAYRLAKTHAPRFQPAVAPASGEAPF